MSADHEQRLGIGKNVVSNQGQSVIEPASFLRKIALKHEAQSSLGRKNFGEADFNRFSNAMVRLMGGVESAVGRYSHLLVDPNTDRAYAFYRYSPQATKPWDFSALEIYPRWLVDETIDPLKLIPHVERHAPIIVETIIFGSNTDHKNEHGITRPYVFFSSTPPLDEHAPKAPRRVRVSSYASQSDVDLIVNSDDQPVQVDITAQRTKEICKDALSALNRGVVQVGSALPSMKLSQLVEDYKKAVRLGVSVWPPHVRSTRELQAVRYNDRWDNPHGHIGKIEIFRDPVTGRPFGYR